MILVFAYGHHSLGTRSYKQHPLYEKNKADFLDAYLEDRRGDELRILRQLVPYLNQCKTKLWLLTVVAKEDLWYRDRLAVEQHYREGEYGREVEQALAGRDRQTVRHEFAFASLVVSNFDAGLGERLKKNTEGYDQRLQVESIRRLIETVAALKRWEEG